MKRKGRKKKGLNFLKKIGKAVKKVGKKIVTNHNDHRLGGARTHVGRRGLPTSSSFGGLLGGM